MTKLYTTCTKVLHSLLDLTTYRTYKSKIIHNTSLLPLFKRKAWANQKSILCSSKGLTTCNVRDKPLSQWVKWSWKNMILKNPRQKKRMEVLWRSTLWKRLITTVQRKQGKEAVVCGWHLEAGLTQTLTDWELLKENLRKCAAPITLDCQGRAGPHSMQKQR